MPRPDPQAKNCVKATDVKGSRRCSSRWPDLELCEKDLADFLESKRRIFPRFYFLATTYLLDVLSNGNRPSPLSGTFNNQLQGINNILQGAADEVGGLCVQRG